MKDKKKQFLFVTNALRKCLIYISGGGGRIRTAEPLGSRFTVYRV